MMIAAGLAVAGAVGLSLGLLGGGGSIITVPVLVYLFGYDAKVAIAMSLPVVGVTSLAGAALHWRLGGVHLRMAALFGMLAMLGALAGAKLAVFVSGATQLTVLATVMLGAAGSMLRDRGGSAVSAAPTATALVPRLVAPVALAVGALTGLVGIGGGFLVVPALVLLARVPMRQAIGTSLVVISMSSAAGFAGHLGSVAIDWAFLAGFTAAAVAGVLLGTVLTRVVPQVALMRAFAALLAAVGAFMLYQNRGVFHAVAIPEPSRSGLVTATAVVRSMHPHPKHRL